MKKISVCMTTYNGQLFIYEQVKSILNQDYPIYELIIADDFSTDNTIDIIKSFGDKRIKIFQNLTRLGVTKNFEKAISLATGDYIFLSDQDDVWLKNKTLKFSEYFKKNALIISNANVVNKDLNFSGKTFFQLRKSTFNYYSNLIRFSFLGCCMAFPNKNINKLIPFPNKTKYLTHDNWIFIVMGMLHKVSIIKEPLMLYRRHETNLSEGGFKRINSIYFMLKYRIYIYYNLIKRLF